MKQIKLSALISICLVLVLAALPFMTACRAPAPTVPAPTAPAPPKKEVPPPKAYEFPEVISITSYEVGSSGYVQWGSISEALSKEKGITMRVVPSGTDTARLMPLLAGKIDLYGGGMGVYWAQEGLKDFSAMEWGPQRVALVVACWAPSGWGLGVPIHSDIKTIADLKGKRVAYSVGAAAQNANVEAMLRFGGLNGWDDVIKVEVSGTSGPCVQAFVTGAADAGWVNTDSGAAYEGAASPAGIRYLEVDPNDVEGWKRAREVVPFAMPMKATIGANVSEDKPANLMKYGYPVCAAFADKDPNFVAEFLRLLFELYPAYKDVHPSNIGWKPELQALSWVVPYHEGAIRVYKELGLWTAEDQKRNDSLLERQEVLREAWVKALAEAEAKKMPSKDFPKFWEDIRASVLKAHGLGLVP